MQAYYQTQQHRERVPRATVTCIVSDGVMSFTLKAADQFGIPEVLLWTTSACGLLGYLNYRQLVERGYTPLKDMSCVTNGYLETTLDWVPGMENDIKLRDFPSFISTQMNSWSNTSYMNPKPLPKLLLSFSTHSTPSNKTPWTPSKPFNPKFTQLAP